MENNIRKFRLDNHLSQRALAEASGTTQQLIQRMESGIQETINVDVAMNISKVLEAPFETIFPAAKRATASQKRRQKSASTKDDGTKLISDLEKIGFSSSAEDMVARLIFSNGYECLHPLSGKDLDRVWKAAQRIGNAGEKFVIYFTESCVAAVNLDHVFCIQFIPSYSVEGVVPFIETSIATQHPRNIEVLPAKTPDPIGFDVLPDEYDFFDPEDELGPVSSLIQNAQHYEDGLDIADIQDDDLGLRSFIPYKDVAMFTAPLSYISPPLGLAEDEGRMEDHDMSRSDTMQNN